LHLNPVFESRDVILLDVLMPNHSYVPLIKSYYFFVLSIACHVRAVALPVHRKTSGLLSIYIIGMQCVIIDSLLRLPWGDPLDNHNPIGSQTCRHLTGNNTVP
jgi:hypothetical protein